MDLLYANDRRAAYPDSWYAATAETLPLQPALEGAEQADICIVGAGYTGLSAALHLAGAGRRVVVLEAQRIGFGASGRNGGQIGSGQRLSQRALERMVGPDDARHLFELGRQSRALVSELIDRHGISCELADGVAALGFGRADREALQQEAAWLRDRYGYDRFELLDESAGRDLCPSPVYAGGFVDWGAGHLHPLKYAFGLGRAAMAAGARICEQSRVTGIAPGPDITVHTDSGQVRAKHVVLACNGYLGQLDARVAARVMPINNFIVATEPLGNEAKRVLTRNIAVADTKFVVNYFRLSPDGRLLFGGGESYGYRFPSDIAALVRRPMTAVFPHLRDVRIDYAWGGTLAITVSRMPYLARPASNMLSASGYSGHGVAMATLAGQLMAKAIQGETDGFDCMARVPARAFPGGVSLRSPLLALAMTWYALRDRIGF